MRTWLIAALISLGALAAGCSSEHELADHDAAAVFSDSGTDAGVHSIVRIPDAMPDAPLSCASSELSVEVRVEAVTMDATRCATAHVSGAALTGIEASPTDTGVRFHFDFCPNADADCRCDVVVSHVGTDIAGMLSPDANVTVDLAAGTGFVPGAYLAITKLPTCQCDTCGCSEPLYFYASNTTPDNAPHVPMPMTFGQGAMVCPAMDCTSGGSWMLHARGDVGEADVPGGTQRDLGSVHVRSLRDIEVFAPCAACAECDTPIGAWAAWVSS